MTETASKSDLSALLERVRGAKGASLDLDLAIEQAVGPFPDRLVDNYTQSIDAALALVERVFPELDFEYIDGAARLTRHINPGNDRDVYEEYGETIPLAILAALLSALIAKEQGNDE